MTSEDFKKQLDNPKNIYCLVSSDSEMIDLYIKRFKDAIQADNLSYGSIKPYGKLFMKKTLNVLYMPKLEESIFERNEFIFIHTDNIDKRTALYKKYSNQIIELSNDYTNYIMKHSDMNKSQANKLCKMCNNDLGIIKNNLLLYNTVGKVKFNDYSNDIFNWVECFIKKEDLPRITESTIAIMALLSANSQSLLKIKQNNTKGMNPYLVKNLSMIKDYRSEDELVNIISTCFYLDLNIKNGNIQNDTALKYLIAKCHKN